MHKIVTGTTGMKIPGVDILGVHNILYHILENETRLTLLVFYVQNESAAMYVRM
jgi:hypothetical protein